jgi:hypothetical protein
MTAEGLATLVNVGIGGAVVAVVIIFLNFIEKRDKEYMAFFNAIRQLDNEASNKLTTVIDKLVTRIESLEDKFDQHDATEMEFLRGVVANMNAKPTRSRTKKDTE